VVANAVRDHVSEHLGEGKAQDDAQNPSVKRFLNEFAQALPIDRLGVRPPITAAQTARQVLDFARGSLPEDQYAALTRWVGGATFEEIEDELGLTEPDAGRKLVRAAIAVLRRRFAVG